MFVIAFRKHSVAGWFGSLCLLCEHVVSRAILNISWSLHRFVLQAFPDLALRAIIQGLYSIAFGHSDMLDGMRRQQRVAVVTTLLALPLKVLLLLLSLHLLCLPYVAEQQKFRFELSEKLSSPSPQGSAGVFSTAEGESVSPESRAERRRLMRVIEGQLTEAKRVVTLSFLGILLSAAIGAVRFISGLGSMEPFVFTMLAAYGCLRHSNICQSQPDRCCAVVASATTLLVPVGAAGVLQVFCSVDIWTPWEQASAEPLKPTHKSTAEGYGQSVARNAWRLERVLGIIRTNVLVECCRRT
jgi:hypothetical protein